MTIQVSDGIQSTYVWVLIQLSAVNEHRPGFLSNPKITVNENSAIGTMIFKYEADDGDAPPHGVTSYKILNVKNGNQNYFLLDKTSGKIFLGEKLDFEKIQQYEVVVMATDGGRDTTTGTVTINIDNGNDHAPFCKKSSDAISVSESEAIGHVVVADFGCYDVDNNPLTFSLSQNPSDNTFVLDPATKQLKVKGTLDYERTSFYKITITISDGIFSTSLKLSINILNVNEVAPQFIKQDFQSTVSEAATIGTSVATVSATDSDNDTVTYSFLELYPHFVLNPKSGKIILRAPADRETSPTFILYVLASDGEKSSTATVSVTVEDINEHPVFKQSSYQLLVSENTATGTTVGSISAVDDDEGINGQVHYRIVSGNDDSKFHIDISKGIISVVTPIDYEDIKTVVMAIEAFDLGSPSLSTECSVIVKILDKNDNAPELLQTVLQERVSESALIGQSVISVFAEDADSSLNDNNKITYFSASLVPFQVNPVNGTVTVTGDLDRETKDKYEMVITATDGGNPRMTGTLSLKIIVSDVNDHDPVITGSYVTTVSENAPEHSVIFNISAYDADTEKFGKLNYEIILGNLNSIFKIESNTGVVQLATTLDREYKDRYELIVKVTDNGVPPRSSTVTAVVNVGDENDSPPVLSKSVYEFSIQEHVRQNTLVGNIEATDKDIGKNAKLKYSIATIWKGNTGVFDIKEMTGEILTNGVVDREAYDEYSLLMRAKDSGTPTLFSDVIVKIKIDDINDNPPIFRRQEFSTAIFENLAVNSKIHTTGATDRDVGINAIIKYELDISNKNGLLADYYFGVYGNTGDIFLKRRIDREAYDELTFTVIVRDTGVPSLSSSANVTVQIQDVNDNRPVFSPVFYNSEVSSVKLCDAEVTKITATDADLGKNAAINFELETKDLPFVVSPLGKVKANGKLVDSKYVFKIMAHDNGNPFLTSSDPALVRVDRFDPNKVVITFHLGMTLASFYQMETNFLQQLEEALLVKYVTPYVKRWCVLENKESVLVYIYAVKTELTNDIKNLHRNKAFLTNGEFLDLLEIDVNGRPFIEDERWDEYKIEKVVPYGGKRVNADPVVSPVEESDTSLAVPLALSLLLIIGIIIAVLILCLAWRKRWCRKKKKKEDLKTRAHIIEKMGQENDGTVFEKEMERVPSTINPTFSTAFLSANTVDEPLKPTKNTENTSAGKGHEGEDNRNSEPSPFNSSKFAKRSLVSPAYSGNEIVNPVPTNGEKLTNYVLATSPKTTKRGKDIVTGWIYEEDPQTKVRNWIRTPTGENQSSYFY
ncbi:cadherin-related tumor suppressor-like [Saccostrea echinata]|uniref:cadherin-related tumor suppressor-like n=1 Tax=Saccostrea echinata TaxID=191078 RepID=UPI002A7F5202|nr:cadherin-related tumor suppressor-like [Saccostrea echinata]